MRPQSETDEGAWRALVDEHLYRDTAVGPTWTEQLWSLYARCGYFDLSGKAPDAFASLKEAFFNVAHRLDAYKKLGVHVVYPEASGSACAALSVLKVYSGTWLGFQMAKVKGDSHDGASSRKILRDIHIHAYEHAQRDPNLRWLIGYAQVKPIWSRAVHIGTFRSGTSLRATPTYRGSTPSR